MTFVFSILALVVSSVCFAGSANQCCKPKKGTQITANDAFEKVDCACKRKKKS